MKKYILQLVKSMTFGVALVLGSILGLVGVYAALNWDGLTANVENNTPLTKDLWNNTIGKLKANIDALDTRMTNVENSGGASASNPFSFADGTSKGATGLVTDSTTGLMWESQGSTTIMNWTAAGNRCSNLTKGGYTDWRLPTAKELVNFYTKWFASGAYLSDYFSLVNTTGYWSDTSYSATVAWLLSFNDGTMYYYNKASNAYVLCVR